MLPTLEIDFTKVCHMEPDVFGDGQYKVAAYTHIYNAEALRGAAVAVGENLDGFLSKTILSSMMSNQVKTKLIFFYVVYQDFIEVSVSNVNLRARCDWLCNIEGHYESGRAFLQENAKPFMFWNGSNLYRIYSLPGNYDPRTQYASDFGSLSYLIVSEVDKSTYQEIKDNKAGHWDYSIVPEQHEEVVVGETERLMLFHSFYKVIRSDG